MSAEAKQPAGVKRPAEDAPGNAGAKPTDAPQPSPAKSPKTDAPPGMALSGQLTKETFERMVDSANQFIDFKWLDRLKDRARAVVYLRVERENVCFPDSSVGTGAS